MKMEVRYFPETMVQFQKTALFILAAVEIVRSFKRVEEWCLLGCYAV
jgi:hypothetical protein